MNKRKESSNATKVSKPTAAKKPAKTAIMATFPEPKEKDNAEALAKMALKPSINAAVVMEEYGKPLGELDLWALVGSLSAGM